MLKHITVPVIIDDHEPEKCGKCEFINVWGVSDCVLFSKPIINLRRCKQCLEEAK